MNDISLIERITMNLIHKRDTDAGDTPCAFREVVYSDSTGAQSGKYRSEVRLYNNTAAPIVKGQVCLVDYKGLPASDPQVNVIATNTPAREVVVATEAIATASWGWFCIGGWVDALVEGTTAVAIGDYLKLVTATSTTGFIKDSSTTWSTGTVATAAAAQAAGGNVLTLVEHHGGKGIVA